MRDRVGSKINGTNQGVNVYQNAVQTERTILLTSIESLLLPIAR
jgi:hypothetical protein